MFGLAESSHFQNLDRERKRRKAREIIQMRIMLLKMLLTERKRKVKNQKLTKNWLRYRMI